jgi:hypothetical protein
MERVRVKLRGEDIEEVVTFLDGGGDAKGNEFEFMSGEWRGHLIPSQIPIPDHTAALHAAVSISYTEEYLKGLYRGRYTLLVFLQKCDVWKCLDTPRKVRIPENCHHASGILGDSGTRSSEC